ncbi:hypothetical protein JI739_07065 [Ramlibacter sp. AW1]|uniref:Lipoprotein n=1 Tax=Ramlibacter aurantiacus TaxID=2801330 RepID=A0A936ZS52_9BURK|nr:hypothetical protein [Ramlibacter aurantiacus]MBL0420105.1 hypothetical protein [Ramlibacter aurantiacus]
MKARAFVIAAGALALLAGCSEEPQTASGVKSDTPNYAGTGQPYALSDWKQGDKASWEQQLRTRNQTQNEYVRVRQQ